MPFSTLNLLLEKQAISHTQEVGVAKNEMQEKWRQRLGAENSEAHQKKGRRLCGKSKGVDLRLRPT